MPSPSDIQPVCLEAYRTAIPMRSFEHAAARRDQAQAVVVRVGFSDGSAGWGEMLPRSYVTGESFQSVQQDIEGLFWPALRRSGGAEATAEVVAGAERAGRCVRAAACAVELACWGRPGADRAAGGGPIRSRVSGVLGSSDPARTDRRLRLMRWFGLRDFKLKLGLGPEADAENLRLACRRLGRGIRRGRCTLRVDVNGGWQPQEVPDRVAALRGLGLSVVEQPSRVSAAELADLARRCELPLMADESLVSEADAMALLAEPRRVWWNLRLSKNGGLGPTLRLARLAEEHGVPWVAGCMVGESGILSAAQRRLLQLAPLPRFVEGNYGRWLLADDLTTPSPRFGYGGRLRALRGPGLGVRVRSGKIQRYGRRVLELRAD